MKKFHAHGLNFKHRYEITWQGTFDNLINNEMDYAF